MTREQKMAILKDIIDGEIINPQVRKDVGEWALKALEQEPRKGHWIANRKIDTAYDISGYKSWAISYVCEHCGFIHQAIENHGVYNFCPNCGAKMESEVDNGNDD